MKSAAMAGIVAVVFVVGIGVGVLLTSNDGPGQAPASSVDNGGGSDSPRVAFADGDAVMQAPAGTTPDGTAGPAGPGSGDERGRSDPPGTSIEGEPPPPPPIPPDALREMEDLRRENDLAGTDKDPGGKVTPLVYDFKTEEERLAWEEKHRARWERRLKREIDIKVRQMRESIGLQAPQENALRKLLDDELAERGRLTSLLNSKKITRSAFDEGVRANVAKAKARLTETLTEVQLVAYNELKPREQVLREETH